MAMRASIGGAMGIPLGCGIARSGESLASIVIAGVVLTAIAFWEYSARERAYYKWVRSAPSSDRNFPVPHGFNERFRHITAEQPLYRPVLMTLLGIPATLFLLLLSVSLLMDDPLQEDTFIFASATLLLAAATVMAVFQWRLKRRMLRAIPDAEKPATEVDRPGPTRPNPAIPHRR
jgi:hypothetical protein